MPATLERPTKRKVAVADDNPKYRDQKSRIVAIAGFEPVPLDGQYPHVRDLLDAVKRVNATALVCDHKLSEGNYAGFEGVEAVAELYGSTTPGILVTDYGDSELRNSIRRHRDRVPSLIRGTDFEPENIVASIENWEKEVIRHEIPVWRRPRRALVTVDEVGNAKNGWMHTVFVPRWRMHEAISLPKDSIPADLLPGLKSGSKLISSVNTEAERIDELYFKDFEAVPDEDLTDATA
jgi:hypothetical protein